MTAGRPTTYKPSYCDRVIALGREGKSQCEIAEAIGVARTTMRGWAEQNPAFAEALKRAKDFEQAWWERTAREGLRDHAFNAALWSRSVSARFREDYTERREVGGIDGQPITVLISGDDDKL